MSDISCKQFFNLEGEGDEKSYTFYERMVWRFVVLVIFWLFFYAFNIIIAGKKHGVAILHDPIIIFLLISFGVMLIWSFFEACKALVKETSKEIERISKEWK